MHRSGQVVRAPPGARLLRLADRMPPWRDHLGETRVGVSNFGSTAFVETARDHEASYALPLIDAALALGFSPETAIMDKGYDTEPIHDGCEARSVHPIIPLKQTQGVKRGDHLPPTCEPGVWKFAGADFKRKRTKWRCPTGECVPFSKWVKASRLHPLIPRETKRWGDLYRGARGGRARLRTA
jgi:Transposase DDE domain